MSFVGSSSKANYSLSVHPAPHEDGMPAPVDSASGDEWPAEHWHMPNPQETIDTVMLTAPPPAHMEVPHTFFDGVAKVKPLENLSRLRLAMLQARDCEEGSQPKAKPTPDCAGRPPPPPPAPGHDGGAPPGTPPAPGGAPPCVPKPLPPIPTDTKDLMNELAH